MMTPYLQCEAQHERTIWAWTAGYTCWYCERIGTPSHGPTITPTTDVFLDDPDPHGEWEA